MNNCNNNKIIKPLFIPLYREYFNAFADGSKKTEYRKYGPRWNEKTCFIGRPVLISLGYGKQKRLIGKIIAFRKVDIFESTTNDFLFLSRISNTNNLVAEIDIEIN